MYKFAELSWSQHTLIVLANMVRPTEGDPKASSKMLGFAKKNRKNPNPRKYRYRSNTVALREIRRYQRSTELLSSQRAYEDLVRSMPIVAEGDFKFSKQFWKALRCASEDFLTDRFSRALLVQIAAGAQTLTADHMKTTAKILKNAVPE